MPPTSSEGEQVEPERSSNLQPSNSMLYALCPMRRARTWTHVVFICIPFVISIVCFESVAVAQTKATFTPRVSVSETYDDNIDLDPDDEDSDYITIVSPGGNFQLESQNTQLEEAEVFGSTGFDSLSVSSSEDMIEELEQMDPSERQAFMDELAVRSDFWDEYESEVLYE